MNPYEMPMRCPKKIHVPVETRSWLPGCDRCPRRLCFTISPGWWSLAILGKVEHFSYSPCFGLLPCWKRHAVIKRWYVSCNIIYKHTIWKMVFVRLFGSRKPSLWTWTIGEAIWCDRFHLSLQYQNHAPNTGRKVVNASQAGGRAEPFGPRFSQWGRKVSSGNIWWTSSQCPVVCTAYLCRVFFLTIRT